ncbi:MAG: hypothetical protein JOZ69_10175 [Myxococcales bacterium]|nr:hypothetical protein [Myxococcales bacterium]
MPLGHRVADARGVLPAHLLGAPSILGAETRAQRADEELGHLERGEIADVIAGHEPMARHPEPLADGGAGRPARRRELLEDPRRRLVRLERSARLLVPAKRADHRVELLARVGRDAVGLAHRLKQRSARQAGPLLHVRDEVADGQHRDQRESMMQVVLVVRVTSV